MGTVTFGSDHDLLLLLPYLDYHNDPFLQLDFSPTFLPRRPGPTDGRTRRLEPSQEPDYHEQPPVLPRLDGHLVHGLYQRSPSTGGRWGGGGGGRRGELEGTRTRGEEYHHHLKETVEEASDRWMGHVSVFSSIKSCGISLRPSS